MSAARGMLLTVCFGLLAVSSEGEPRRNLAAVVANADLTEDGKKFLRPTPDKPSYYVPVILGWQEAGRIVAGEEPPKREEVLRQLGQALAKEGYILQALRPDANKTLPSLIITVEWGYLNPQVMEHGALDLSTGEGGTMAPAEIRNNATQATASDFNHNEMVALVTGVAFSAKLAATGSLGVSQQDWDKIRDAVAEGRYFIIVSAYDFAASLKGEQKLLWRARMSTERQGLWMRDVVPALVMSGSALFGRQTDVPAWREFRVRDGHVELGELKIIETDVKPAPPEANDAKASPVGKKP